ncbi:DUF2254 family protein [Haloferax sp. YSSS75]|uniref:DUF2254 family protein n=1 Tax=Haloferax sp. YSSS75 TaxID=3388564 RepID=UPI00398CED82
MRVQDQDWKWFLRIVQSYSVWEWRLVIVGVIGALFFLVAPLEYDVSNANQVLSTLATAQASLLAIVFSVSILGVQLIANRYSARMTKLITSSAAFQATLVLLFASVAFDLFLLFNLPTIPSQYTISGISIAAGLALASGVTLNRHVNSILARSTPEGILEAYEESVSVEDFREAVSKSVDSFDQHPLHELHELVMSALSRHEWATAKNGIRYTNRISVRIIEQEAARGNLWSTKDDLSHKYFRTPLEEYLPRTAKEATSSEEIDLAEDAIKTISDIGQAGISSHRAYIASQAVSGLTSTFQDTQDNQEGHRLRVAVLDSCRTLLVEALEKPAPHMVSSILSMYRGRIRVWLIKDYDKWTYRHHLRDFYDRGIAIGLDLYLQHYGEYLTDCTIDWSSRNNPESSNNVTNVIFYLRRYSIETTLNIFRYIERNDEWPILMTGLRDGWKEICKKSAEHEVDGITRIFIRHYIDIAYIVYRLDREKASTWSGEVAHLKGEIPNGSIVDEALSESRREGMTSRLDEFVSVLNRIQEPESTPKKFIREVTDDTQEYSEWIKSFQREIQSTYEEYHAG